MDTDRITVLELDLSKDPFETRFDHTTDTWTDSGSLPEGEPLFEFMTPVHGDLRLLAVDKANSMVIIIILDTVIVFEYRTEALSYKKATGFENGLIVKYFTEHLPNSIVEARMNSKTF